MEESSRNYLKFFRVVTLLWLTSLISSALANVVGFSEQPLSKIAIHKTTRALRESVSIRASPVVLGLQVHTNFISY